MAELPPFRPPSETGFPQTTSRPPGPKSPLWSCAAGTTYKILGFLGPRDCTGDRTGVRCFCAAGCTQPSGQFMQLGQPARCWRCASASTRPRPPPTTSAGGSIGPGHQGAFAAGAVPGAGGTNRISTQSIESTSMWHAMHLRASTDRYRSIYPIIT